MNSFWKSTLINIAIIYAITLISMINGGLNAFLLVPLVIAVLEVIVALILLIPAATRNIAQVMLAAAGIVLAIGAGVCSVVTFSIH